MRAFLYASVFLIVIPSDEWDVQINLTPVVWWLHHEMAGIGVVNIMLLSCLAQR